MLNMVSAKEMHVVLLEVAFICISPDIPFTIGTTGLL